MDSSAASTPSSSATGAAIPDSAADILTMMPIWWNNLKTQTGNTFSNMRAQDYIRLVIIVGAYALLRPYLMKLGAKMQMRAHEKDSAAEAEELSKMSPNELRRAVRAKIDIPGVESETDSEDDAEGASGSMDWGRKARLRQRKFVREQLARHERMLAESKAEMEDEDIKEFLVD